jgi:hypothetical protein
VFRAFQNSQDLAIRKGSAQAAAAEIPIISRRGISSEFLVNEHAILSCNTQ